MKQNIILLGSEITKEQKLLQLLSARTKITLLQNISQLETHLNARKIALVIMEISNSWEKELNVIDSLKASYPEILFIIVNGGGSKEAVIESFQAGASDFFKKPLNPVLLAERVEALINTKATSQNNQIKKLIIDRASEF